MDPPPKQKRAGQSCTQCRRFRQKCVHPTDERGKAAGPCDGCTKLGVGSECIYTARGFSAADRQFRRKRPRSEEASLPLPEPPKPFAMDALLPPQNEIEEGVRCFINSYFQLGFIAENHFLERLKRDPESISPFLLLSILTISARFSPKLIKRYGSRHQATEAFVSRALSLAGIEMMRPSLEGCQAFFLLGASDFGHGFGQRSWMLMGVAVRMAGILRLHREETFKLPPNATSEEIIAAEVARRTFWALYFHHDLTSTLNRPASFPLAEITCFLPCSEEDLIFGQLPTSRAALEGTEAARLDSEATNLPSRSLYASLVQSHCLWGKVARLACRAEGQLCPRPWEEGSEFATMHGELVQWEKAAPARHKFSVTTLRGMKAMRLDLAFLATTTIIRLSYLVLARMYLPLIAAALDPQNSHSGSLDGESGAPEGFWLSMAHTMAYNAFELLEQVDAFFSARSPLDGFPPPMVFGIYTCGNFASFLWRWPSLCPEYAPKAETMLLRCIEILGLLREAWPVSERWHRALLQLVIPPHGTRAEGLKVSAHHAQDLDKRTGIYGHEDAESDSSALATSPQLVPSPANPPAGSPSSQAGADLLLNLGGTSASTSSSLSASPPAPLPAPTFSAAPLGSVAALPHSPSSPVMSYASGCVMGVNELMPFDSLGADLTSFLNGDVIPSIFEEYRPDQPGWGY